MSDGKPLFSAAHPVPPWWKRLLSKFKKPVDISEEALEVVEIEFLGDSKLR